MLVLVTMELVDFVRNGCVVFSIITLHEVFFTMIVGSDGKENGFLKQK